MVRFTFKIFLSPLRGWGQPSIHLYNNGTPLGLQQMVYDALKHFTAIRRGIVEHLFTTKQGSRNQPFRDYSKKAVADPKGM
jgi:hypothetical protein